MNIIELKGITQNFAQDRVLSDLNWQIEANHIYGLLGRNGAGKSTLFKIILGFQRPVAGKIKVNGHQVRVGNQDILKNIAFSINEPRFYEHLTAVQNLSIHCQYMVVPKTAIVPWLIRMGLDPKNTVPVNRYSMGMRQRLSIARCMLGKPDLLILDEPLNGLDPKAIVDLRGMLQQIATEGTTVVFSSHILSEVKQVAEKIAVLVDGQIGYEALVPELEANYGPNLEKILIEKMEGTA